MTHDERVALIEQPLSIRYIGTSYPWGGCAVMDTFYGTHGWAERTDGSKVQGGSLLASTLSPLTVTTWDAWSPVPVTKFGGLE